jgi:hypothetical protein
MLESKNIICANHLSFCKLNTKNEMKQQGREADMKI